jgi:Uncharacterized conserved protein
MAKAKVITGLDAQAPTGDNARVIIKTRLDELLAWDDYVDNPYNVRELHNLRIAAKRLRYTIEIFAPLFAADSTSILREVEQIQTELGSLHDADVMIALLRLCLGGEDGGQGYEQALAAIARHPGRGAFSLNPAMLAHIIVPGSMPTAAQRVGMEALLQRLHVQREEQYAAFRRHWYQLKGRDFEHEVLRLFGA